MLNPHSAIAYLGLTAGASGVDRTVPGMFLATAHPAKFGEIVEPILGRSVPKPPPLLEAIARGRQVMHLDASLEALKEILT